MNQQIPAILAKPRGAAATPDGATMDQGFDLSADLSGQPDTASGASDVSAPAGRNDTLEKIQESLGEHKGKLAIGAAATLGLMIYYKWREKNLAKEDPQEYARLQRIKSGLHIDELAPLSPAGAGED